MGGDALIIEHTTLFVNIRLDVRYPCFSLMEKEGFRKIVKRGRVFESQNGMAEVDI